MKYTINDIATLAGVSKATVSRVINNSKPVSSQIRERVLKVTNDTGFQPSQLARSLSNKETKLIGVILPDFSNPIFAKIIEGIEEEAIKNRYNILLCSSRMHPDTEVNYLDVLIDKKVDALIYNGFTITDEIRSKLVKFNVPVVMIGIDDKKLEFPLVAIDNFSAAYDATIHLIKQGHNKISMIHGPKDDPFSGKLRLDGFLNAMNDNNLDELFLIEGRYKVNSGFSAMNSILDKKQDTTAVFCANDEMAIGAIKAVIDRGLKVPEDISIMGFDNIEMSGIYSPSLSTVSQPFKQKGISAIQVIIKQIAGEEVPPVTRLKHKILERASIKRI